MGALLPKIFTLILITTVITTGKRFAIASIPQFQKKGAVPKRALTVGTPRISCVLFTSGKFLKYHYISKKRSRKHEPMNLHSIHVWFIIQTQTTIFFASLTFLYKLKDQYQNNFLRVSKKKKKEREEKVSVCQHCQLVQINVKNTIYRT